MTTPASSPALRAQRSGSADDIAVKSESKTIIRQLPLRFSVVIPLYNKGRHIERALRSTLSQSLPPAEILVIDDGSTDDGPAIARTFPGVRLIERGIPGPGGYAARNRGIAEAVHPWIAFLDADDAWDANHLSGLSDAIGAADAEIILAGSGYREKHPGDRWVDDVYSRKIASSDAAIFGFEAFLALWLHLRECPVWTSAIVARRDILDQVGLFPADRCRRGGDKDLWLRMAHAGAVLIEPAKSATYFKDSDNMVTQIPHANQCHCLIGSIDPLIARETGRSRTLLKRLSNDETFRYALRTARGARLERSAWRSFRFAQDPLKGVALALLSTSLGAHLARAAATRGWRWAR